MENTLNKKNIYLLVTVAALGYFVDLYDLVLFNVIKKTSLEALNLAGTNYEANEMFLFNWQMGGMLLGGILWGILGDKKGRLAVLFGSILLYSTANIANAFVGEGDLTTYALIRLLAGIGLAGELGAGITLVVETMDKETRGYGTMIIVTFGALGAVFASIIGKKGAWFAMHTNNLIGTHLVDWQMAYIIGGLLGLFLLLLRVGTMESDMFKSVHEKKISKGNFFSIFKTKHSTIKYFSCILIGLPIWYIIGILTSYSVGIGKELGIIGIVTGEAIMYTYIGLSFGDLISGLLSQIFKTRKKIVVAYLIASCVLILLFLFPVNTSLNWFYFLCFLLGTATGYWALFVTIAAEQFGTNIRSTVTNTVPNFVRGAVIPISILYKWLCPTIVDTKVASALIVGVICIVPAFIAILSVKETYGKELNYTEE